MDTPSPSGTPPPPPLTQPPAATQVWRPTTTQAATQVPFEKRRARPNARAMEQRTATSQPPPSTQPPRRHEESEEEGDQRDANVELGERISALCRRQNSMGLPPSSPVDSRDSTPTPPERNKPRRANRELGAPAQTEEWEEGERGRGSQSEDEDEMTKSEAEWEERAASPPVPQYELNSGSNDEGELEDPFYHRVEAQPGARVMERGRKRQRTSSLEDCEQEATRDVVSKPPQHAPPQPTQTPLAMDGTSGRREQVEDAPSHPLPQAAQLDRQTIIAILVNKARAQYHETVMTLARELNVTIEVSETLITAADFHSILYGVPQLGGQRPPPSITHPQIAADEARTRERILRRGEAAMLRPSDSDPSIRSPAPLLPQTAASLAMEEAGVSAATGRTGQRVTVQSERVAPTRDPRTRPKPTKAMQEAHWPRHQDGNGQSEDARMEIDQDEYGGLDASTMRSTSKTCDRGAPSALPPPAHPQMNPMRPQSMNRTWFKAKEESGTTAAPSATRTREDYRRAIASLDFVSSQDGFPMVQPRTSLDRIRGMEGTKMLEDWRKCDKNQRCIVDVHGPVSENATATSAILEGIFTKILGTDDYTLKAPPNARGAEPGKRASAWLLSGIAELAQSEMVIQYAFSRSDIAFCVYAGEVVIPRCIGGFDGCTQRNDNVARNVFIAEFEDEAMRAAIEKLVVKNAKFSGMRPSDAVDYIINTIDVELRRANEDDKNSPLVAYVYIESPTDRASKWDEWRKGVHDHTFSEATGRPIKPHGDVRCGDCHGTDHTTPQCLFGDVDDWVTGSVAAMRRAQSHQQRNAQAGPSKQKQSDSNRRATDYRKQQEGNKKKWVERRRDTDYHHDGDDAGERRQGGGGGGKSRNRSPQMNRGYHHRN
ncbi:hypothetical protein TRAPUB_5618 [Trametes pubescens]|uniref:Uncharacterized protein n=1 Tax=Trametes pubescens TaxID=154538 RepID=A0A1M2V8F9_TRAPU|nr:hypothetical protein TRAPUB_5618 [Trametes pubescens]